MFKFKSIEDQSTKINNNTLSSSKVKVFSFEEDEVTSPRGRGEKAWFIKRLKRKF